MSKLYGTLQGCAGEATRRGTESSGINASVQSWNGSLIVNMELDGYENPIIKIDTADKSTNCSGDRQFNGTLIEFNKMCQLYKEIKEGKVSVTRHRQKSNKQLGLERAFK